MRSLQQGPKELLYPDRNNIITVVGTGVPGLTYSCEGYVDNFIHILGYFLPLERVTDHSTVCATNADFAFLHFSCTVFVCRLEVISPSESTIDSGCLKTEHWGEYLTPKTEKEMGQKLQNGKCHNLCFSVIVMIKEMHENFYLNIWRMKFLEQIWILWGG